MRKDEFMIKAEDGFSIECYRWYNPDNSGPKGIIQIAHGMAEHALRYENFAEFLVANGYEVFANDHRGHGKTAGSPEKCGYLSDKNGWNKTVLDMKHLTDKIKEIHPGNRKIILMGHSMGSFLTQSYIQQFPDSVRYIILSGTNGNPGFVANIGIFLTGISKMFGHAKKPDPLMNSLSFSSFNKSFKPNETEFDWLSRDKENVRKYIEDPYCGGIFTTAFFNDLLKGLKNNFKKSNLRKINKNIKIHFLSGVKDPVGGETRGVTSLMELYKSLGITDITYKFYPDGRHEMLNEINKNEVYRDILSWLDSF